MIFISYFNNHITIDEITKGFLVGSKLGDACFIKKSEGHNTYIVFKHCEHQYEYLKWKYDFLKQRGFLKDNKIIKEIKLIGCFDNAQRQFNFSTRAFVELNEYYNMRFSKLINSLNEMGLSVWILDDGSINKQYKVCKISIPNKTDEEKNELLNILSEKFGLDCYIYNHPRHKKLDTINIRLSSYQKIRDMVLSNVGNIEIVKEKLNGY